MRNYYESDAQREFKAEQKSIAREGNRQERADKGWGKPGPKRHYTNANGTTEERREKRRELEEEKRRDKSFNFSSSDLSDSDYNYNDNDNDDDTNYRIELMNKSNELYIANINNIVLKSRLNDNLIFYKLMFHKSYKYKLKDIAEIEKRIRKEIKKEFHMKRTDFHSEIDYLEYTTKRDMQKALKIKNAYEILLENNEEKIAELKKEREEDIEWFDYE